MLFTANASEVGFEQDYDQHIPNIYIEPSYWV